MATIVGRLSDQRPVAPAGTRTCAALVPLLSAAAL